MLLFRAGSFHHLAVPLPLVARLEKVPTSKIERAAGHAVLQYRGNILSLVRLASVLDPSLAHDAFAADVVQVIVFTDGTRHIGVVVDEIVDIVDEPIKVRRGSSAPGLLGSAVIGGRVTDLLDLHAVVGASGQNWLNPVDAALIGHKLLLVDSCLPAREMIAEYLGASGFDVISVTTAEDAVPRMRQTTFDLVITAVEMRGDGAFAVLKALRHDKQLAHIPILGLVDHPEQVNSNLPEGLAYDARILRSRREDLLLSINTLVRSQAQVRQLQEVA